MRSYTVAFTLLLCLSYSAFATGGQESSEVKSPYVDKTFTLYALAEKGSEAEMFSIERMAIPSALALSAWTAFSFKNDELSTEGSASYSMRSSSMASSSRADGALVLEYRVSASYKDTGGPARSSQEVVFGVKDCLGKKGEVLYQPARLALIRAVGMRKLSSGTCRVAELSFESGSFKAKIEFR
jgi:hypothetical protein